MCLCANLCYHVWNAGPPPRDEDVGQVLNWPPCESYISFPCFTCLLLQISFYMSATQAPLEEIKMSVKWTFHADPVFVRFDVTAFPTPTEVTFTFLGFVGKRHWQPPDGARRHQTGGCLWAAQGRSVQVHVLCHSV